MTDWTRISLENGLFNLITMYGNTKLLFSKRMLITKELLNQFDLLVLQYREDTPSDTNRQST